MKRTRVFTLVAGLMMMIAAVSFADGPMRMHHPMEESDALAMLFAPINTIVDNFGDKAIGSLTLSELNQIYSTVSVARQKAEYVQSARAASWAMPGLGQLKTGDTAGGVLFLSSSILVSAGSLVGSYFLLPADLRFDSLDYFTQPYSGIKSRWENHSFLDYLPTMGVMAGGMVVDGILRMISSHLAETRAIENIRSGTVTFEPEPLSVMFSDHGMMYGAGVRMRY